MSIDCTRWAWTVPDLPPTTKLVLLQLADRANAYPHHYAWPTVAGVAADTGLSRRQVQRALGVLRDKGLISPIGYGGKTGQAVVYALMGRWDQKAKQWQGRDGGKWSRVTAPLGSSLDPWGGVTVSPLRQGDAPGGVSVAGGGVTVSPPGCHGGTHNHQTTTSNQQQPAGAPTGERAGLGMQPADLLSDLKRSLRK